MTSSFACTSTLFTHYWRARLYLSAGGRPLSVVRAPKETLDATVLPAVSGINRYSGFTCALPRMLAKRAVHQGRALPTELRRHYFAPATPELRSASCSGKSYCLSCEAHALLERRRELQRQVRNKVRITHSHFFRTPPVKAFCLQRQLTTTAATKRYYHASENPRSSSMSG